MAHPMSPQRLIRRCLIPAFSTVLACAAIGAAGVPPAAATTYSFKPARAENGTILFVIKSVRPASVRAGRVRAGRHKPYVLNLASARRAAQRGRLRLPVEAVIGANSGSVSADGERMTIARRRGRLKIVVDTTPPETAVVSGTSGTVTSQSASFAFSSPDSTAKFQCRVDSRSWNNCESPKAYTSLTAGTHTFLVRAYDPAGNVDATPADRTWTVELQPPATESSPEPANGAPMSEGFDSANGPNNLITNEYAAWHSWDSAAVGSPVWKSDGGSLFSVSAVGPGGSSERVAYNGALDDEQADRYSEAHTHSDKLRFFTKAAGFGNVQVGTWIKPLGWGAGAPSSWGGFKLYLRREKDASVSSAYTAEPYIYDGHAYIQKKCEGQTGGGTYANGGTYYLLASKSGLGVPLGSWHQVAASSRTNSDGSVTISLYRDGALVLQAVDRGIRPDGTGCAPLEAGHTGFRSDFLQYYLDDFTVTPQS
jgi:hypothetical protein